MSETEKGESELTPMPYYAMKTTWANTCDDQGPNSIGKNGLKF